MHKIINKQNGKQMSSLIFLATFPSIFKFQYFPIICQVPVAVSAVLPFKLSIKKFTNQNGKQMSSLFLLLFLLFSNSSIFQLFARSQ